jgi:hypothetical protein
MSSPIVLAWESSRACVCWPIPRRGELTTRVNDTASAGFAIRERYATASLISARS